MDDFEHLQGWELLVESRQYRSSGTTGALNLRNVADFAFLDLISLFILNNEYETAPVSKRYAGKTIGFRNFSRARLSGTDLYTSLNILTNPDSIFSKKIQQNPEKDSMLRSKVTPNNQALKRYLDLLSDGKMSREDAAVLLLRFEKQFNITDSKLRSIRRLAQDWSALNDMQKELLLTRMLQYYRKFAKRSELAIFIEDLGLGKGYKLNPNAPIDAELATLGYGEKPKEKSWVSILAPLAAGYAGYKLGRHLFGPDRDK